MNQQKLTEKGANMPKKEIDKHTFKICEAVNYPQPKGCELRVFASTEPLVLTQYNWEA